MKWPDLVPRALCCTPIRVTVFEEGPDEDGAPVAAASVETRCNWQSSAQVLRTNETHEVQLSGVALLRGDPFPEVAVISAGEVEVFGAKRTLHRGSKARNPDGTVNYTRLEVL